MAKSTMTLTDNRNGKQYEYNIVDGTRGPSVVVFLHFIKILECLLMTQVTLQLLLVNLKLLLLMAKILS